MATSRTVDTVTGVTFAGTSLVVMALVVCIGFDSLLADPFRAVVQAWTACNGEFVPKLLGFIALTAFMVYMTVVIAPIYTYVGIRVLAQRKSA